MQKVVRAQSVEARPRIFVSYSRKDMAFADRLEAALRERGFEVLIDREEIYAFEDWWKRIEALISSADTIVFVLSPDAVQSDVALKEVRYAASLNKRFAPIMCLRVEDSAVPEALRRLNFIFFDDAAQFEVSADKLAEALQTDIGWIRRHTEFGEAARRWVEGDGAGGLLIRPPVLDQAEAWMAFRPSGAPSPTGETEAFIAASRKAETAARRRSRVLNIALYTMLVGIILGLVGWINQAYIAAQWRWYSIERPFLSAKFWPYVLTLQAEKELQPKDTFRECATDQQNDYCPEMVLVPAGSFIMGSPSTEPGHTQHEEPQHTVIIAKPFAVAKYELTFNEWDTCVVDGDCTWRPSDVGWGRGRQPVIYVSLDDAKQYVVWLSKATGKQYRLLSESEYEYATRAGSTTTYPWGNDLGKNNANCDGCGSKWDNKQTAPVGSFAPNGFGLFDMVGNVWEWVEDCAYNNYDAAPADGTPWRIQGSDCQYRVIRAGSWYLSPDYLRSALRGRDLPNARNNLLGFRVARTLASP